MENGTVPFIRLLIDGEYHPALHNKTFEIRNPLSERVVGHAAAATSEDCKLAIESAGNAFKQWEQSMLQHRRDIFLKAADLLESERFAQKITNAVRAETAAEDSMSFFNIRYPASALRDAAGEISNLRGETFPSWLPDGQVITQRRAADVMFVISPSS